MIKRNAEMEKEVRERMREGTGTTEIVHVFRKGELTSGKTRLFARMRLPPGSSIGYHRHDAEEEIFYILAGTATVTDDGSVSTVGAGDAVLTGDGHSHSIANNGSEPLEFMAVILQY
ncbi:MAG TPA: cupin domain-containing protein [Spirochaetia bacterium]